MDLKRNNAKKQTFHHHIFHIVTCKSASTYPDLIRGDRLFGFLLLEMSEKKTFCKTTVEMLNLCVVIESQIGSCRVCYLRRRWRSAFVCGRFRLLQFLL